MAETRFSRSQGFEQPPALLSYDDLPDVVREEVFYLLRRHGQSYYEFADSLRHRLRIFERRLGYKHASESTDATEVYAHARLILLDADWHHVFDLCQELHEIILDLFGAEAVNDWNSDLNHVFDDQGLAWRAVGPGFEKVMDDTTAGSIQAAKSILREPRFEAPNRQFALAIKQFNERPEPNLRGCVTEAIESVEGVARIIMGKPSGLLPSLLNTEPLKGGIHPTLREALIKIYAYRGDVTSHGQTEVKEEWCGVEEGEWLLGMCANSIVYLSKKIPETGGS